MRAAIVLALSLALSACGMHWPWRHGRRHRRRPVQELIIAAAEGTPSASIFSSGIATRCSSI